MRFVCGPPVEGLVVLGARINTGYAPRPVVFVACVWAPVLQTFLTFFLSGSFFYTSSAPTQVS